MRAADDGRGPSGKPNIRMEMPNARQEKGEGGKERDRDKEKRARKRSLEPEDIGPGSYFCRGRRGTDNCAEGRLGPTCSVAWTQSPVRQEKAPSPGAAAGIISKKR